MITFEIAYNFDDIKKLADAFPSNLTKASLPKTATAFQQAVEQCYNLWVADVSKMPGVTSKMVQSILIDKDNNTDFDKKIYTKNKGLIELNDGAPAKEYDMKQTYPYAKKSRVSKKGIPYLIIPFRWGTKKKRAHFNNFIPEKIYNTKVSALEMSRIISEHDHVEPNARGEMIDRFGYEWIKGSRLQDDDAWEVKGKNGKTYSSMGMVRMTSEYFTFRIISAKSPPGSWIRKTPAKPATNYMDPLVRKMQQKTDSIIEPAFKADVENLINGKE